jgi:hypothetical protein
MSNLNESMDAPRKRIASPVVAAGTGRLGDS